MNNLEANAEDPQLNIPREHVSKPRYPIEFISKVSIGNFSKTKLNGKN
jgi:hypothetical protein